MALEAKSFSLDVLWSTEINGAPPAGPVGTTGFGLQFGAGLIVRSQAKFSDGRIVWLGNRISPGANSQVLFAGAEHARANDGAVLSLRGVASPQRQSLPSWFFQSPTPSQSPYVSALAVGHAGEIWVAGFSNTYLDIASARHSDGYLAAVDGTGRPLWEKTYGNGGRKNIRAVTQMASGDLAISGSDGWDGWVARLNADGNEVWARRLGNDQDNAVAALPGDRLVLAGFEGTGSAAAKDHQHHVTAWIIDESGAILAQTRVRNSINQQQRSYFGQVSVAATPDAIYVTSNWRDDFNAQPVEVAKLQLDGTLLWHVVLPDTITPVDTTVRTWKTCSPALAVDPSGDVIVACSLEQIQIYKFDGRSGAYSESHLPLPECHTSRPASLILAIQNDGSMMLSGSRPVSNVGASCTWIGRLTERS